MSVSVDPSREYSQAAKIVIDWASLWIDSNNLRTLNDDASVMNDMTLAVEDSAGSNDYAFVLSNGKWSVYKEDENEQSKDGYTHRLLGLSLCLCVLCAFVLNLKRLRS